MVTHEIITAAITDAGARKAQLTADHHALQQQMIALNARGVDLEKAILICEGELKSLMTLREATDG